MALSESSQQDEEIVLLGGPEVGFDDPLTDYLRRRKRQMWIKTHAAQHVDA